jgi:PAS domain S-box-containing protein
MTPYAAPPHAAELAEMLEHVGEAVFALDGAGRVSYANTEAARLCGLPAPATLLGRAFAEVWPGGGAAPGTRLGDELRRAGESGLPAHFECRVSGDDSPTGGRWAEVYLRPVAGGPGAGLYAVCREVTGRKRGEARRRLLAGLNDRLLAPMTDDPELVLFETARTAGDFFGVSRCAYGVVDDTGTDGTVTVHRDYVRDGAATIAGTYRLEDFGPEVIRSLRAGRAAWASDVSLDPRTRGYAAGYGSIGARAFLYVPLHRGGRWVSLIVLHHAAPRAWTAEDVETLTLVGERTWLLVEAARLYRDARRSEERYRSLVNATAQVVWVTDAAGRVTEHFEQGTLEDGRTFREAAGAGWLDYVHPDDRERVRATWAESVRTLTPCYVEYRWRAEGGAWRHVAARGVPVLEADGATVREWVGTTTDVDDARRAEAALRESEERLRLALSAARQRAWEIDLVAGRGRMSGEYGRDGEASGDAGPEGGFEFGLENAFATVHADDVGRVREEFAAALRGERPFESRYRVLRPSDGQLIYVVSHGAVVRDPDTGAPVRAVGVLRDETREREAEQTRAAAAEQQRRFLRDVLSSVTEGRLRLCDADRELPELDGDDAPLTPIPLTEDRHLAELRAQVERAARDCGMGRGRTQDLVTAASEAGMNALTHGRGGTAHVACSPDGAAVRVRIEDRGTGIDLSRLPDATLRRGYSSRGGLGHGFWLMLQTCDAVYLRTGPEGTTVVLEQFRDVPEPPWLRAYDARGRREAEAQDARDAEAATAAPA